jgi:plastocyanin
MEKGRVRIELLNWRRVALAASFVLLPVTATAAGTGVEMKTLHADTEGEFPESRFGYSPTRVKTGLEADSLDRASNEWGGNSGSRSPASESATSSSEINHAGAPRVELEAASVVQRKGVQEVALIAGDLGYFPKTLFVTRDIPVRMFVTGSSKNSLCVMMDSFQVRKQIRSQKIEEISFTPNRPGKYRFYCPVNGMEGTLVVRDLAG